MTSLTSNCARLRAFSAIEDDTLLRGGAGANEVIYNNANPRPYRWKAEGAGILEKISRARAALALTETA